MKKYGIIALVFLTVLGCREPFDFDYQEVEAPKVVIEGFISDRGTRHAVKVSTSTTINDRGLLETQFIEDAQVRIEDDQGGFTLLSHLEAGIYLTAPQYRALEGRSYTLLVTLANGEEYRSPAKSLPPPSPATAQLSVEGTTRPILVNNRLQEEEGGQISVTIDKNNERHFYQWLIGHYFIYEADLTPEDSPIRYCYVREFDEARVDLLQDNPAEGDNASYTYDLDFVPITSRTEFDFAVEGRLLTMNEEDYNFWEKIKRLSENSGGLFDAAPFSIEGNITNESTGEEVLGYFGVYRESIDRVFFNQRELGFGFTNFPPCQLPPGAPPNHPCLDCRTFLAQANFGVTPPVWWRN